MNRRLLSACALAALALAAGGCGDGDDGEQPDPAAERKIEMTGGGRTDRGSPANPPPKGASPFVRELYRQFPPPRANPEVKGAAAVRLFRRHHDISLTVGRQEAAGGWHRPADDTERRLCPMTSTSSLAERYEPLISSRAGSRSANPPRRRAGRGRDRASRCRRRTSPAASGVLAISSSSHASAGPTYSSASPVRQVREEVGDDVVRRSAPSMRARGRARPGRRRPPRARCAPRRPCTDAARTRRCRRRRRGPAADVRRRRRSAPRRARRATGRRWRASMTSGSAPTPHTTACGRRAPATAVRTRLDALARPRTRAPPRRRRRPRPRAPRARRGQ